MTKSYDYWKRREDEARENTIKDEERYNRELEEIYKQMFDEIEKDINDFFTKYAKQESISITEAKKRVSKLDMEKYERKAKKYVAERDFSEQANEEMRIYNLTMKVNRLEMLKANIGLELVNGYQDLEDYLGRALNETVRKEIKRQAGILGETAGDNKKYADNIVNASFQNATWSERIWNNQEQLKHELHKTLSRGLIQGRNPIELVRELRKTREVSVYDAERLLRTEMCRVQIAASLREIKANGFTQYVFLADDGGSRTCEVCQSMNGRTFKIEDGRIGVNLPPLHPNCRCSVAGHIDDDEFINWLEDHGVELTDQDLEEMGLSRKDTTSDLDFMAGSIHEILQFNTKEGPIDVKFNCIDDKKGIYAQVWNEEAKKTVDFLKAQIKNNPVLKDVDKIMVFKDRKDSNNIAAYDHERNVLFVNEKLMKKEFQTRALSDYFAARTPQEVIEHEMVHKRHWDKIKSYYESNKNRFDKIEEAKQELESDLRKYVATKMYENPYFLEQTVSGNAYDNMVLKSSLNELIADGRILINRNDLKDEELCRLIEEVLS